MENYIAGDLSTIGKRIRKAREEKGIFQNTLARQLGLTSGRIISNWENEIARPDTDNIVKLCQALNVSAAYILGYYQNIDSSSETVNAEEFERITKYRMLDEYGKKMVDTILNCEYERLQAKPAKMVKPQYIRLPYYDYAASAGTGLFLSDVECEYRDVEKNELTVNADYAIPVSGNSMEPMFYDGDVVLVKVQPVVSIGEIGIFLINGEAYIKKYEGKRLVSLNSKYPDIPFTQYDSIFCKGKVLGKL